MIKSNDEAVPACVADSQQVMIRLGQVGDVQQQRERIFSRLSSGVLGGGTAYRVQSVHSPGIRRLRMGGWGNAAGNAYRGSTLLRIEYSLPVTRYHGVTVRYSVLCRYVQY